MKGDSKPPLPAQPPEGSDATDKPAPHEDWLLDEALAETFPASDPIAPARSTPGQNAEPQPPSRSNLRPAA